MPPAFVQAANSGNAQWINSNFASVGLTFPKPISPNGFVVGHVTFDDHLGGVVSSVQDDKSNNFNVGTNYRLVADTQAHYAFWVGGIINRPSIVTVNFSVNSAFNFSQAAEYSGVNPIANPLDMQEGNVSGPDPGGGVADACVSSVSGSVPKYYGDLIVGMIMLDRGKDNIYTAGTGFNQKRDTGLDGSSKVIMGIEDILSGTLAAQRATFTVDVGAPSDFYSAIMVSFQGLPPSPLGQACL